MLDFCTIFVHTSGDYSEKWPDGPCRQIVKPAGLKRKVINAGGKKVCVPPKINFVTCRQPREPF
jgi:hypothetical protein